MPFDPNASFGKSLFLGEILEDQIFPWPDLKPETQDTVRSMVDAIGKFMGKVDGRKLDEKAEIPPELIQEMREMGLFGLIVPEQYGGLGLDIQGYTRVLEEMSSWDASLAITVGAHSSIGFKGLLLHGTEEQKAQYLPRLATGELIAAFALTEPGSGSDAYSIKTRAEKTPDGKHYVLNGQKIWITNGGIADFFTVFAKTSPDSPGKRGSVTAFMVTRDMGGVTHGPHEDKMGLRASSTTSIYLDNVKVPVENVLGEEGKGFKVAMSILNHGRTGIGAGSLGGMKRMLKFAIAHARERKQFGKPIAEFGLVKEKIARLQMMIYACESLTYLVGGIIDRGGQDYSLEGAATKVFTSEALWNGLDEALQVAGGMGYMKEQPYERALRDARINRIYEGTNEINRLYVGLTGVQTPGEYLKGLGRDLTNALRAPIKSLGMLKELRETVQEYAERKVRQTLPYDRQQITKAAGVLRHDVGRLEDAVQEFAALCETELRKHGKNIVEQQFATRRLADIAIDLIAMLAVISRTTSIIEKRGGADKAQHEIDMTTAFCHEARRRVYANFRSATRNHDDQITNIANRVLEAGRAMNDTV